MIRKEYQAPSYTPIEDAKKLAPLYQEISRMKPEVEVTLAGGSEIARGIITEWYPKRHFFTVKFSVKTPKFDAMIEAESGLRAFFKAQLFSAPLVFKSTTLRRLDDLIYHYQMPEQIYQQQRRGALRVPITAKSAQLQLSNENSPTRSAHDFEIIDLSAGGAKLKIPTEWNVRDRANFKSGAILRGAILKLSRKKLGHEKFEVRITSTNEDSIGCRFVGLNASDKLEIKQFLIESLHRFYKTTVK